MSQNFENIEQVMDYNKDVMIISLLDAISKIDDNDLLNSIKPPEEGLYFHGQVSPMFGPNNVCRFHSKSKGDQIGWKLNEVDDIDSDILNPSGGVLLSLKKYRSIEKLLKTEPTIPSMLVRAGACLVKRYLYSLCPDFTYVQKYVGKFNSVMSIFDIEENLDDIVKEESLAAFDERVVTEPFADIFDKISEFVKDDSWSIYTCYLKNTNLIVIKGIDWRIYDWYKTKFEREDYERERGYTPGKLPNF